MMLLDAMIVICAAVLGALLMSAHERDKEKAVYAERKRAEGYREQAESMKIETAWERARIAENKAAWLERAMTAAQEPAQQPTPTCDLLDAAAEKELRENGAVVRRRTGKQ